MPLIIANTFIKIKAVNLNFLKKKQARKSIMNQKGMMLQMAVFCKLEILKLQI